MTHCDVYFVNNTAAHKMVPSPTKNIKSSLFSVKIYCRPILLGPVRRLSTTTPDKAGTTLGFKEGLQGLWQDIFRGSKRHILDKKYKFDGLSKDNTIIYENNNRQYFLLCYTFTAAIIPYCFVSLMHTYLNPEAVMVNVERDKRMGRSTMGTPEQLKAAVVIGTAFLAVMFVVVAKLYRSTILRIYINQTNGLYTAVSRNYFLRVSRLRFASEDTAFYEKKFPVVDQMFGNMTIKGKLFTVSERDFLNGAAYRRMVNLNKKKDAPKRKIIEWRK